MLKLTGGKEPLSRFRFRQVKARANRTRFNAGRFLQTKAG
jgi:hypothetical protein